VLAERNAEITAELAALRAERGDNSRVNALEHELQAMTGDFQDLTREALQMEHERGQLDSLIDGLRDRVESLEGQLSDERVRWIGVKSPGETAPGERNSALPPIRETTSVMVMRQEFKRMMRETRAEGVRLLKVSGKPNLCTREPVTNNPFRPNKTNVANSRPRSAVSRTAAPPITTPCLCLRG
jgi:hypothetical protein